MAVLSVGLASRRYRDNGIAMLLRSQRGVEVELLRCEALGLLGTPDPLGLVTVLDELAKKTMARMIILDGPQGWRGESSELVHQRSCEQAARTPGKTGLPRVVKPSSWTRMAKFSISLFDALSDRGWPRLTSGWSGEPVAVESFPTHGWRTIGFRALPGKGKHPNLAPWLSFLETHYAVRWPCAFPTHDELQAVIAGIGGLQLLYCGPAGCDIVGEEPRIEGGLWREGFIVSPKDSPADKANQSISQRLSLS